MKNFWRMGVLALLITTAVACDKDDDDDDNSSSTSSINYIGSFEGSAVFDLTTPDTNITRTATFDVTSAGSGYLISTDGDPIASFSSSTRSFTGTGADSSGVTSISGSLSSDNNTFTFSATVDNPDDDIVGDVMFSGTRIGSGGGSSGGNTITIGSSTFELSPGSGMCEDSIMVAAFRREGSSTDIATFTLSFNSAISPGTFNIAYPLMNATNDAEAQLIRGTTIYTASSGTITISSVGGSLSASLNDIVFDKELSQGTITPLDVQGSVTCP